MTERISHQEYVASVRKKIVTLAREMLAGNLSFLEGSVEVSRLAREAEVSLTDPDFGVFSIVESETDAIPVGNDCALWSAEALAGLQPEIARAEQWAKATASPACRSIIERFDA